MEKSPNGTPESRDRFRRAYTEQHLRELQLALLDILIHVARICERHNITYWLDGGTLLGAVRHDGFIPWDDDIDIAMPYKEFVRFEEVAKKELPEHLFLQTSQTEPENRLPIIKVRNLNSFFVEFKDDFSRTYSKGLYIDIFPMKPWPSLGARFSRSLSRNYCRANAILHTQHYYGLRAFAEFFYFGILRFTCRFLWKFCSLFVKSNKYYSYTLANSGFGTRHLRSSIFPTSRINFEGTEFSAPADCDQYLRDHYGDYHTLPPVEKRYSHAVFFTTDLASHDNLCHDMPA